MPEMLEGVVEKISEPFLNAIGFLYKNSDYAVIKSIKHKLMEEVAEDKRLSPFERMALINEWNTIQERYRNKIKIVCKAHGFIGKNDTITKLQDDWRMVFFENAQRISDDEIGTIWAHILAEELRSPNSIPKYLLQMLSVTDRRQAECFEKVCRYKVQQDDRKVMIILPLRDCDITCDFDKKCIEELQILGYIKIADIGTSMIKDEIIRLRYGDKSITIRNKKYPEIKLGHVKLTSMGAILSNFIQSEYNDEFINMLRCYYNHEEYDLEIH